MGYDIIWDKLHYGRSWYGGQDTGLVGGAPMWRVGR